MSKISLSILFLYVYMDCKKIGLNIKNKSKNNICYLFENNYLVLIFKKLRKCE